MNALKTLMGTPKHLSLTGQLQGFTYLMLNLAFKCNLRCLKCFNLINNKPSSLSLGNISLAQTMGIIVEAKNLGGSVVVFAGEGETTLNSNIQQLVARVDALGMIPIVYSNATTLAPNIISFYHQHNVCLVVALDSLKTDVHQRLTGSKHQLLSKALRNLDALRKTYADTITYDNGVKIVRLAINTTICSLNKDEIAAIKSYAGDDMYFVCNPLAPWGNATENWNILTNNESNQAELTHIISSYSESGGPLTLDQQGICGYSINGIAVNPQGEYMTCAYTTRTNGLLGNINNCSLQQAYQKKNIAEHQFYSNHGVSPCLVRSNNFSDFISSVKGAQ